MLFDPSKEFRIVIEHDGMRKHQFSIFRPLDPAYRSKIVPESWDNGARDLGVQIVEFVDEWVTLFPFEQQIRSAFLTIDQTDGPPMAYYEVVKDGRDGRYTYQTFAWRSDSADKIVARVSEFARSIKEAGQSIVWRSHPTLNRNDEGKFYFSCRLHVLPYVFLPGAKPEGEAMPEA